MRECLGRFIVQTLLMDGSVRTFSVLAAKGEMMTEYIVRESGYPGTIKKEIVGELVRCSDCKWWDNEECRPLGYCHAAKHCYYSRHWEIQIYWTTEPDFFCKDGERREDEER
jgi:hypothetical protein